MEMENRNTKMLILNYKMTVQIIKGNLKEENFKMKKEIINQDLINTTHKKSGKKKKRKRLHYK